MCDRVFLFFKMVHMPQFQSRLFNWIDRSLPAKLGRSARQFLDQKIEQLSGISVQELPRWLAYQVAKGALYPVYLIASTAKRTFPAALDHSKVEIIEQLRSQPDSEGLLPECDQIAEDLEQGIEQGRLAKFLNWIERSKIQLDRSIAAMIKLPPEDLATTASSESETRLIANRIFAKIWQQQVDQQNDNQDSLKESNGLAENTRLRLEQLRSLIEAAIAYFFGKRSLDGDQQNINNKEEKHSDFLSGESDDKIQTSSESSLNQNSNSEGSNPLKFDDRVERLQKLIEDAIAYFFGRQLSQPTLDEASDIQPSESAWLTMEDVFGNDNGPWPLPLEYESHAFHKSPDKIAIHSSGELQNFETTTSQISQDRIDGSLIFEEELLMYQQSASETGDERPLRAWIEANATIMGYAYNPVMTIVLWVDTIIVKIEDLMITFWKGLINFPKRFVYFIRYGNREQK